MARRPSPSPRAAARRLAQVTALEYPLRIELRHIEPRVWRRVRVPDTVTLARLHDVLQRTMGWSDAHLHEYQIGPGRYGLPDPDCCGDEPLIDERRVHLKHLVEAGVRRFTYRYDLADDWEHSVQVEDLALPEVGGGRIRCIGGENACPPEDVGGITGYFEFLRAIKDPMHERHSEMLRWIDGPFDPTAFDVARTNERLAGIRHKGKRP